MLPFVLVAYIAPPSDFFATRSSDRILRCHLAAPPVLLALSPQDRGNLEDFFTPRDKIIKYDPFARRGSPVGLISYSSSADCSEFLDSSDKGDSVDWKRKQPGTWTAGWRPAKKPDFQFWNSISIFFENSVPSCGCFRCSLAKLLLQVVCFDFSKLLENDWWGSIFRL